MIYTTPGLERFELSWHIDPKNIPRPATTDAYTEFLAVRFMEDVFDSTGGSNPSFTITEVRLPEPEALRDTLVEIVFHITASVNDAMVLKSYDFDIYALREGIEGWDYSTEPEGLTWGDLFFQLQSRHMIPETADPVWDKEIRAPDDSDPEAPWFRILSIKSDDDGIFLAIEEVRV